MLQYRNLTFCLIVISFFLGNAWGEDRLIKKLSIKPNTYYRLSFKADVEGEGVQWLIHMLNEQGERPFEGSLEHDWQQIVPERKNYIHTFLTPPSVATLDIGLRCKGALPAIQDVRLEQITVPNVFVNGDFSAGRSNFSGWSETAGAHFIEVDGKLVLKVEHNGYAITDRVPVIGNTKYQFTPGSTTPSSILAYGADMHLVRQLPSRGGRDISVPAGVSYLRLLYKTGFDQPSFALQAPSLTPSLVFLFKHQDLEIKLPLRGGTSRGVRSR